MKILVTGVFHLDIQIFEDSGTVAKEAKMYFQLVVEIWLSIINFKTVKKVKKGDKDPCLMAGLS